MITCVINLATPVALLRNFCDTVALPADDPGFSQLLYTEEMIARAPHIGVSYQ
jgi:hypothetical protein